MKQLLLSLALCIAAGAYANDGVYYTSGNQLIPIFETDVAVTKEVLRIIRINRNEVKVVVDYTFHNPSAAKQVTVGFEARSPRGDADGRPKNGQHPNIRNFTVQVNGQTLPYQTAIVTSDQYVQNNAIVSKTEEEVTGRDFNPNYPRFNYVNHFDALFKPGENSIHHEYIFTLSSSIELDFNFDYILTAANRWANRQIDDFTLILELGEYCNYNVMRTFFNNNSEWQCDGKLVDVKPFPYIDEAIGSMGVYAGQQPLVFKQLNFQPSGELSIYKQRDFNLFQIEQFDAANDALPYEVYDARNIQHSANETSFKILRNLPFACRGYVFKTEAIQRYYESMPWYQPRPGYEATTDGLKEEEMQWLEMVRTNKWGGHNE